MGHYGNGPPFPVDPRLRPSAKIFHPSGHSHWIDVTQLCGYAYRRPSEQCPHERGGLSIYLVANPDFQVGVALDAGVLMLVRGGKRVTIVQLK